MSAAPFEQFPTKLCSACGTLTQTVKTFCPVCGTVYGEPGGGRSASFVWGAFACAAVSLLFFPIVLGPLAIVLSAIAMKRKEPQAALAMGLSVAGMVLGFIFGAIAFSA
ncbi:hypothetical protein OG763_09885 [Streptomyces sp. NBC_01230]|uniref:hypothetical protein n=1 Tax=Streptomyces sp. NBC_01230 TaxID=2903784 RepID=UPI002E11D33A|nr:hypothetical protein OG763_09885 [Streptomyces sp. NBC_01230]